MLNKKTILFFTDEKNVDLINNVINELPGDGSVVNVVVTWRQIQNQFIVKMYDKFLPKESNLRRKIDNQVLIYHAKNKDKLLSQKISFDPKKLRQKRIHNVLTRFNPTMVVVDTHLLLTDVIAALDKYGAKVNLGVICGEFVLDKRLIHRRVDCYFVDNFGMRNELCDEGVPGDRIVISGYPVDKKALDVMPKEEALKSLALDPIPTILVSASVAGDDRFIGLIKAIDDADLDANVVVACGESPMLISTARERGLYAYNSGMDMNVALDACDVLVCRPTTMLLAEAIAKKKAIFTIMPLGKAEEDNMKYLSGDYVTVATDNADLVDKLRKFFESKQAEKNADETNSSIDKEDYIDSFDALGAKRIATKLVALA